VFWNQAREVIMTDQEVHSGEDPSVRKLAEALLQQEHESYADLVNSQPEGVYRLRVFPRDRWRKDAWNSSESVPYCPEFVNDRFCEILGIDRQVFETNPGIVMDLVHPDDKAEFVRRNEEAGVKLVPFRWDGRLLVRGKILWVHFESLPRQVANGDVLWTGILYDISDRKRAEEALRDSEERYRTMIDNLPGFVYRCVNDRDWTMSFMSDGCRDITGYAPEDFVGNKKLSFNDIIRPDYQERVWLNVQNCVQQKKVFQHEYPIVVASGETDHWVWERGRGIFSDAGQLLYVEGFVTDITDRKRVEDALRESETRLREAQEMAHLGFWSWNIKTGNVEWSDEVFKIFGLDPNEFTPHIDSILALSPWPEDHHRDNELIDRATRTHSRGFYEQKFLRPDESIGYYYSTFEGRYDENGELTAIVGTVLDITDRKRAEEAREQAEAQLHQSQKMEAIGTLAGGVAHDFNNLLTGILGNVALMRAGMAAVDPLLENLNATETAARQAADLTQGLLTFGRSAMVLPVSMKVADALNTTLAILKRSLPATIEIVRDDGQATWSVLLDQSQMTQILLNLAVNARDAMEGKGKLTIRARNEVVIEEYVHRYSFSRTGEFVHLIITDTGPGIPPAILEHLFEPFHTTKPPGSGTGLGLSIVYGAVKQAGGWITAESTKGIGVTFDIYLPRCMEELPQEISSSSPSMNVPGGTVLVVEDEMAVRRVAQALLTRKGYTVLTAPDGASALNVIWDHLGGVGLVLLDMTMPGMTTDEIVRGVRALDPTLPILLNSGYASNDTVRRMLDEGRVQGFLGKPYDLHQLVENVQKLISNG
jgi:PAS domain S-box-containing protein